MAFCARMQKSNLFLSASIGAFGLGTSLAWTSPSLPRLQDDLCLDQCDVPDISVDEASWIGAMLPLGAIMSGPIAGSVRVPLGVNIEKIKIS